MRVELKISPLIAPAAKSDGTLLSVERKHVDVDAAERRRSKGQLHKVLPVVADLYHARVSIAFRVG